MVDDDPALNELFGEGQGAPEPKTGLAVGLAVTGLLIALLGMACLAAPGGAIVLLGVWRIERELDRVNNGYLSPDARPVVLGARRIVFACLFLVIVLFLVQVVLYALGFYQFLGDFFLGPLAPAWPALPWLAS